MISVDVNINKFLSELSDEVLAHEVQKRDLLDDSRFLNVEAKPAQQWEDISVGVSESDIIDQLDMADLIDAIEDEDYVVLGKDELIEKESCELKICNLYRQLCDLVGCNYHTSKEVLFDEIKQMMQ